MGRIRRARTTSRPAAWLAAAMTRFCSRRAFIAQADDSGHTVNRPESASYDTAATCPASSGRWPPTAPAAPRRMGRELPGPLGDQRADRRAQVHRLAPVAPHRGDGSHLPLRLRAGAVLAGVLHRGPQRDRARSTPDVSPPLITRPPSLRVPPATGLTARLTRHRLPRGNHGVTRAPIAARAQTRRPGRRAQAEVEAAYQGNSTTTAPPAAALPWAVGQNLRVSRGGLLPKAAGVLRGPGHAPRHPAGYVDVK